MKPVRACLWRNAFFVWCSPKGFCKAPHDSGVFWKQFMVLLEEVLVCGGVSFLTPCTSRVEEGIRVRVKGRRSARAAPVYSLISSVVGGVELRFKQVRGQLEMSIIMEEVRKTNKRAISACPLSPSARSMGFYAIRGSISSTSSSNRRYIIVY